MSESSALTPQDLHKVEHSWSPYERLSNRSRVVLRRTWSAFGFDAASATVIRYEADMALLRLRCLMSPAHRRHIKTLIARRDLLVHLGCGNALLSGWVNLDCYPPSRQPGVEILAVDMRQGLPFATGSVAAIFSEHFLEHLRFDVVTSVILPEAHRILKPGGSNRIGVPDGEYFITKYLEHRSGKIDPLFERNGSPTTPMVTLNDITHGFGHHFLYDFDTLRRLLEQAGFEQVCRRAPGVSPVPEFHGKDRLDEWRQAMTLYVEAVRAS